MSRARAITSMPQASAEGRALSGWRQRVSVHSSQRRHRPAEAAPARFQGERLVVIHEEGFFFDADDQIGEGEIDLLIIFVPIRHFVRVEGDGHLHEEGPGVVGEEFFHEFRVRRVGRAAEGLSVIGAAVLAFHPRPKAGLDGGHLHRHGGGRAESAGLDGGHLHRHGGGRAESLRFFFEPFHIFVSHGYRSFLFPIIGQSASEGNRRGFPPVSVRRQA